METMTSADLILTLAFAFLGFVGIGGFWILQERRHTFAAVSMLMGSLLSMAGAAMFSFIMFDEHNLIAFICGVSGCIVICLAFLLWRLDIRG